MPGLALFLDAAKTLCARLGFAQMRLQFSAGFGHRSAIVRRRRACHLEPRGQLRRGMQLGERRFGLCVLFAGFVARRVEAKEGFFERRKPRGGRRLALFGRGVSSRALLDFAQGVFVLRRRFAFRRRRWPKERFGLARHLLSRRWRRRARLAASIARSPRRFFSARRRAAGVGASAACVKPSQRHRSPSFETSLWPGFSNVRKAVPSARATTPIWFSRRARGAGAVTSVESASTPGGKAGSSEASVSGPMRGRRRIGRGVEIVAERRAERRLIAFRDADLLGNRRPKAAGSGVQQFG